MISESKKIILVTGSDQKYLDRIDRYLNSIVDNSNFDENILVYIGDNLDDVKKYKNVTNCKLLFENIKCINKQINCVQHGEFINSDYFDKFKDDDIIFFTDGDVYLQRGLFEDEKNFLRNLGDNEVWVGYNAGKDDKLEDEFNRLSPSGVVNINDYHGIKCYNTGILCMNKRTWLKLSSIYCSLFELVDVMFSHYAKQQWLISYILKDFNVIEMSYLIHNHNIYGIKQGMTTDWKNVYYNGQISLFRHKWF